MAQTTWTGLLTGSSSPFLASGDVVAFVDVDDTTQSASGSLVKGTLTEFFAQLPVPVAIKSSSATAFTVGLNGATNPAFAVDASTALQVAGLKLTGAVTGGTVALVATDSGAAASLTINAKGTGTIGIGTVSTGRVTITPVTTITGALTLSAVGLVYDGKTLTGSTGTGKMVLDAIPSFPTTIGVGAATAAASGSGITFPATQSASTDANTLDDYEEGAWTPSLGGNTTYSLQTGSYRKVGRWVTVQGRLAITTLGTGSSEIISGLPFTTQGSGDDSGFVGLYQTLASGASSIAVSILTNDGTTDIWIYAGSGGSQVRIAPFGNGTVFLFSTTYLATA